MELIILMLLMFAIFHFTTSKSADAASDKLVVEKKECPPHQWFWQEIVDQNGVKQGERIVCKRCGPLSKLMGE